MFKKFKGFLVSVGPFAAVAVPGAAHAAISAADETAILAGITSSDATFYKIGAGVLVVLAGIWGFRKVMGLLGSR